MLIVVQVRACQTEPPFGPVVDSDFGDLGGYDHALITLGRALFFDEELSGNRNISCATCHHPRLATTDGLSLSIGEGGVGIGRSRTPGTGTQASQEWVARNAPALFNLGAVEFRALFHDGRVAVDAGRRSGYTTPAGDHLPLGLASVLAAQALFPLVLETEMAGRPGENEVSDAVAAGSLSGAGGAWDLIAARLRATPGYGELFAAAFDEVEAPHDITIVHVANAIAAYEATAFRSDDSPFDRYLRGDERALTRDQLDGMRIFYGGGGRCSRCHSGPFQTDQGFHAIGMPQIGPGFGEHRGVDVGRENVTRDSRDRYAFRTPSLRNVEITAPYGHAGSYATLRAMLEHYRNDEAALRAYDPAQAILPGDADLEERDRISPLDSEQVSPILAASEAHSLQLSQLDDREIDALLEFLRALTDPSARDLSEHVPAAVPSGRMTRIEAGEAPR